MSKFSKKHKSNWYLVLGFAVILGLFSWWQISGITKAKYEDICIYNYGPGKSYEECMSFFYVQAGYFTKMIGVSIVVGLASVMAIVFSLRDRNA